MLVDKDKSIIRLIWRSEITFASHYPKKSHHKKKNCNEGIRTNPEFVKPSLPTRSSIFTQFSFPVFTLELSFIVVGLGELARTGGVFGVG